ncbi:MAG: arylsulfatase [Ilumatobacteraceae bacterium]
MEPGDFGGVVGRTLEDSTPWWPPVIHGPAGAPNVVMVLLDDVGYAQFGCYGSDIATPTFDRLAAGGLRYSNFHTTALCSPTRACLLTGRNHHASGMARIVEFASGFPGYDATMPASNGFLSEILGRHGYATFAVGKWHLAPAPEMAMGASRARWPLGRGFERFYGFLAGETDQYHPDLVHDNHQIDPPRSPEDGYHLTVDLADRAIGYVKDLRAASADRPFFLYFTPGACHAPHQVPLPYRDRYRGRFDHGWDAWREEVFERQQSSGLLPDGTRLSERPDWVPAWDSLGADERRLYARMMEVFAGFLEHTDAQVGRLVDFLESLGELDNTVFLVMSDNGASAEGGPRGSFNENYFFNMVPESLEENLRRIDDLGGPGAHNHYPWGWAWAGNTPLKRWKRETHEGGVTDPLIVSWPSGIDAAGEVRHQFVHAIDVMPTLLEIIGIEAPDELGGVPQRPLDGASFTATFDDAASAAPRETQYYEMLGCRAIYHDGWKAVTFHPMVGFAYEGSDPFLPFDDDRWELYHVAEDFSETVDLAAQEPERLRQMVELWWSEAERNQALPLNNQPGRHADRRYRRTRYEYHAGIGALPAAVAPNLRNRGFRVTADLDLPVDGGDGVIITHGGAAGGYSMYLQDRRLHWTYNWLGAVVTTVSSEETLPSGRCTVELTFTPTGRFQGDVALSCDGNPVGEGHVPATTPVTYGIVGFTVGYQRGTSVAPTYEPPFALADGVLRSVVIEPDGREYRDPAAEERAAAAMQ